MSLFTKRILMLLIGFLAALMLWPCLLLIQYWQAAFPGYLLFTMAQGLIFGLVFGAAFGCFEGIVVSSRRKALRGLAFGAAFGLVSGSLGMLAGQAALLLAGNALFRSQAGRFGPGLILANGLGWALVGLAVALVEGLRARSGRKLLIGLLGGLCGGLLGGAALQALLAGFPGNSLALLAGLVAFGLALSFFYSFFENRFSAGSLKLLNGPLKDKEYLIARQRMIIGSDAACDIVLAGYPEVAARHAVLSIKQRKINIASLEPKLPLKVNDVTVAESGLRREDVIAVGKAKFFFGVFPAVLCALLLMAGRPAVAQESLLVTQVDASRLLATQTVRLYVDAPAIADPARLQAGLSVSESADGTTWLERPILSVARDRNRDEGISFFFLLDNSGSMWDNLAGQATDDPASQRIAHARQAIETFLTSVSEVDRVGMAIFNSRYWQVQACAPTVAGISRALQEIGRPEAEDAYTELYGSADLALRGFGESGRRKVLIVLSDGENYPYFTHRHEASPQFGETLALPDELAETASLEGISLYSVRLGPERDDAIGRVASSSGGRVFDAANRADMESIYHEIRRRVLAEYTVSYRAAMLAGGKRHVRLVWRPAAGQTAGAPAGQAERFYFAGNILGASGWQPAWYHPLFFILPLLAILALILFRLEKESDRAGLRLLYGFKGMSTKIFNLDSPQTIIGGAANADITIAGNPSLAGQHATILFDDKAGTYTVVGGGELTVNNQTVIKKKLEPGDVINMAGTVVVFDDKLAGTKSTKGKTRP